ncbi:hypothetical protein PIB30_005660 [Stylosanthes scabra]|uniref:Uncharacterized protein n=1 Tax=Stylosanthes scabra TaxID=79078 RepID=A0ABU6T4W8_9FABA|nr:hypothetical protein [Stylosanthes scabra]
MAPLLLDSPMRLKISRASSSVVPTDSSSLTVWEFGEKLSEITHKAQPKRSHIIIWICITAWIPWARVRASLSIAGDLVSSHNSMLILCKTELVSLEWLNFNARLHSQGTSIYRNI